MSAASSGRAPCSGMPAQPQMAPHLADHLGGFLGGGRDVAAVLHHDGFDPGRNPVEPPEVGGRGRAQPALIGELGDGPAQLRGHPPRVGQEVAKFRRKRGVTGGNPAQGRLVHGFGVRALADLRQLLRVAEQQQPAAGLGHGQGVGQRELAGLVDHQQVQRPGRHFDPVMVHAVPPISAPPGEPSRRATSFAERCSHGRASACFTSLATRGGIDAGLGDRRLQQVLHHGVGLADDADFPAAGHQPGDDVRSHMGLAGPGRTLHRQVGMVQGPTASVIASMNRSGPSPGCGQRRPGGKPRRNPADQIKGRMMRESGRLTRNAAVTP